MENNNTNQILVNIENFNQEKDLENLSILTQSLRENLKDLDIVENVDIVKKDKAPEGAKSGDIPLWGSLFVTIAGPVLSNLINVLQSWVKRNENRKIRIKIGDDELEIIGDFDKSQKQILKDWIKRHERNVK